MGLENKSSLTGWQVGGGMEVVEPGQKTRMTSEVTTRSGLMENVTSCRWLMGRSVLLGGGEGGGSGREGR
jgi:hypothetical protein